MIPRKLRLPRAQFAPKSQEKRAISPHFSVTVRNTAENGGCAAVISKKVEKSSVGRHRLKRRVLAVLLPWCTPATAVIVYARAGSGRLPFPELSSELSGLLGRVLPRTR